MEGGRPPAKVQLLLNEFSEAHKNCQDHLLHGAAIDHRHTPMSERASTVWSKERPIPIDVQSQEVESKAKTYLNNKLTLASTYEIPSS